MRSASESRKKIDDLIPFDSKAFIDSLIE